MHREEIDEKRRTIPPAASNLAGDVPQTGQDVGAMHQEILVPNLVGDLLALRGVLLGCIQLILLQRNPCKADQPSPPAKEQVVAGQWCSFQLPKHLVVQWMLFPAAVLNSIGTGLVWPTLGAMLANSVSSEEQGRMSGVSKALGSLMSIFGPLWTGTAYDRIAPAAPFWAGILFWVLAALLLSRLKVQTPENNRIDTRAMAD